MPETTIIIVGAGPAGSVLAGLLARRGVETLLLDKATFPREKVCGDYLSPGTVGLLDQLNLLDLVCSAGARRLWGMTIISPDGTTLTAEFPAITETNGSSPFALSIPRAILDSLLLKWARGLGAKCVEGFRVTDLVWENGHICGVTGIGPAGPEMYRGQVVVGADGRDSVVARRLNLHQPHPRLRRMALVAYYVGARCNVPLRDHGLICIGDRSYCILNPIGEVRRLCVTMMNCVCALICVDFVENAERAGLIAENGDQQRQSRQSLLAAGKQQDVLQSLARRLRGDVN